MDGLGVRVVHTTYKCPGKTGGGGDVRRGCCTMKHLNEIKYVTHSVFSVIYDGLSDLTLAQRILLCSSRDAS